MLNEVFAEELSEFEDYLKEFESTVYFDSEVCPTCGINLSDTITPLSAALAHIQFNSAIEKERALNKIKGSGIMVRERENSDEKKDGLTLLIPENKINDVRKLLENNEVEKNN